ncbi:Spore coat protein SA [Rubripirellula amarantea]|uniref:Spore coat protein SA n=2 Tax=Rubripirellula amarantea TaxID=2527999 RepID=A0A5C5WR67_9BACT|nr:Spore coat protein SA [Rubripirellula amarantea]
MATLGPIAAGTVLPYRRQYYSETIVGSPSATPSHGPAGLVGREVANRHWLEALLKYGKEKSLGFLLYQNADRASLEATLAQHSPQEKVIRLGPLKNARFWLGRGSPRVVWEPQPPSSRWSWLRHQHARDKFAVCGITHALCSPTAISALRDFVMSPVEPYDRLVCTSSAVAATADAIISHWSELMNESAQTSSASRRSTLRLQTIPLGVDLDHHRPASSDDRVAARRHFGIADDANVVLFVGRLSHHSKSNPLPLMFACEQAQRITSKPITLVMAGWFANEAVRDAFVREAARVAPNVKVGFVDATKPNNRDRVWDLADVFVSLADSVQETFGLTIIEAMSRKLPVIASDWNGYRESVVDEETGFLIPTAMIRGIGSESIDEMMQGDITYDHFLARVGQGIWVDPHKVTQRLVALFRDDGLRRAMGDAGRRRVEAKFTWQNVIAATEELWNQQRMQISRYRQATDSAPSNELPVEADAPHQYPARFIDHRLANPTTEQLFSLYPSAWLDAETALCRGDQALGSLNDLFGSPLANHSGAARLPVAATQRLLDSLGSGTTARSNSIAALSVELSSDAQDSEQTSSMVAETAAWALKFDLLKLVDAVGPRSSSARRVRGVNQYSDDNRITFSTTCMGRLSQLKQTLPTLVAQPHSHVVVVDYSCPDGAGNWVRENFDTSQVTVVRVEGRTKFDRSEAKNAGILASPTDWVCLVDADVILAPDFADHLRDRMKRGLFLRSSSILEGTGGTFLAEKSSFVKAELHDCVYQGWGEEDDDLLDSLQFHGIRGDVYDDRWVTHLDHDDELRTQFHEWDDRRISHMINRLYRSAKWDMARMSQGVPPQRARKLLYATISEQVRRLVNENSDVDVVIDTGVMNWVPLSARCARQLVYRIKPDQSIYPGTYVKQNDIPGESA